MKNKKLIVAVILTVVFIAAIFVRTYKYDQWLYFKMDQSRDAFMIANAVKNGPQFLPLLGARAGATKLKHGFLRLGPAFYYFQYLSGKIFNSTEPYVFAYPDLFFSLAVLPLMYLFLKEYFSKRNSLLIVIMYAFSFIVIQYSRFAWNPNSLPFFMILAFYALLKFLNTENTKSKWKWAVLFAFGASITSQLHFFGFFSVIGITIALLFIHFRLWEKSVRQNIMRSDALKLATKYAGIVLLVFLVTYAPVIISDYFKNGQNIHNFFEAMGSKPAKQALTDKLVKDAKENMKYYCLTVTSSCYQDKVSKDILPIAITGLILLVGAILLIRELRRKPDGVKRDFLWLVVVWTVVFTVLTVPVAYQLRPRFFLVVFLIPFIALGFFFQYLEEKHRKYSAGLIALIFVGILAANANGTYAWFKEQANSQTKAFPVKRTLILKVKDGVTLGELQGVTDYMYGRRKNGATIYYYVKPEHVRPIEYLFYEKNDPTLKYGTLKLNGDPNAQFFAIVPAKSGLDPITKKFGDNFSVIAHKQFGQLMVYELSFTNRNININFRFNKKSGSTDRVFWKDVFGIKEKIDRNAVNNAE